MKINARKQKSFYVCFSSKKTRIDFYVGIFFFITIDYFFSYKNIYTYMYIWFKYNINHRKQERNVYIVYYTTVNYGLEKTWDI